MIPRAVLGTLHEPCDDDPWRPALRELAEALIAYGEGRTDESRLSEHRGDLPPLRFVDLAEEMEGDMELTRGDPLHSGNGPPDA